MQNYTSPLQAAHQWIRTSYFWVAGVSVTFYYYILCIIVHLASRIWKKKLGNGKGVHKLAAGWGRTIIKMMPGWNVRISGWENLPKEDEAVVIVANHESMSDIWAMYYLGIQFRWLSKDSVFKIPMVGHAMKWSEYIPIARGNKSSHIEAMRQSEDRISKGIPMFYFPEGTRSPDGEVKEFKIGAFKLAKDMQVPVLPIAIHGAGTLMKKGSSHPSFKATVQMKVLPKVPPPPAETNHLEAYAEDIRKQIIAAHKIILASN